MTAEKLPVIEIFGPVIQGEGAVIGQQTMFIRFGGCDFDCKMCDSRHAIDKEQIQKHARYMHQTEIYSELANNKLCTEWVTYSGGNPCLWDLEVLTNLLSHHRHKIALETQGTYWKPWVPRCNVVTISPKGPGMGEKCDRDLLRDFVAHTAKFMISTTNSMNLKIVCFEEGDLEFSADLADEYKTLDIYLSVGNPYLPESPTPITHGAHQAMLLDRFQWLADNVCNYKSLQRARVLPQLHVLV